MLPELVRSSSSRAPIDRRQFAFAGAVVLKQRSEEANNTFVVGRIDNTVYTLDRPCVFGVRDPHNMDYNPTRWP